MLGALILSLNPSSGICRVRYLHRNTPFGGGLAGLSPQPALTPGARFTQFCSIDCPLDFIVGSAVAAKAVCKLINITIVCHDLDMHERVSRLRGPPHQG